MRIIVAYAMFQEHFSTAPELLRTLVFLLRLVLAEHVWEGLPAHLQVALHLRPLEVVRILCIPPVVRGLVQVVTAVKKTNRVAVSALRM
jgi:hypothetical protein